MRKMAGVRYSIKELTIDIVVITLHTNTRSPSPPRPNQTPRQPTYRLMYRLKQSYQ